MRLTYFEEMYNRNVTMMIAPGTKITFNEKNEAVFKSMGLGYAIAVNRIVSIELLEEE